MALFQTAQWFFTTKEMEDGHRSQLLLIAVGAVLAFAVHVTGHGFKLHTIGIILLVVGAIGALMSMIFLSSWGASETSAARRRSSSGSQASRTDAAARAFGLSRTWLVRT